MPEQRSCCLRKKRKKGGFSGEEKDWLSSLLTPAKASAWLLFPEGDPCPSINFPGLFLRALLCCAHHGALPSPLPSTSCSFSPKIPFPALATLFSPAFMSRSLLSPQPSGLAGAHPALLLALAPGGLEASPAQDDTVAGTVMAA